MAQPADVEALWSPTRRAYASAWDRIVAEQQRLITNPFSIRRQRHLAEMQNRIEGILAVLDEDEAPEFVAKILPKVYRAGAVAGASGAGGEFSSWTEINKAAVQQLAQSAFEDLLRSTHGVRESTKNLVREVGRSEALQSAIEGKTAKQAGSIMEKILGENGIYSVKYRDGSVHGLKEYSEMAMRTKTAVAYNTGSVNAAAELGVKYYEIFDGPECGLTSHDDAQTALGMIVDVNESLTYAIAHPNCRRSFGARPDIQTKADAKAAQGGQVTPSQVAAQKEQDAARRMRQERVARKRQARADRTGRGPKLQAPAGPTTQAPEITRKVANGQTDGLFTKGLRDFSIDDQSMDVPGDFGAMTIHQNALGLNNGQRIRDRYVVNDDNTIRLNKSLRRGDPTPAQLKQARELDRFVERGSLNEDGLVYRGSALSNKTIDGLTPGFRYKDDGFMSTSIPDTASGYGKARLKDLGNPADHNLAIWEIEAKAGQKFGVMDGGEWVLPRGTTLEVIRTERQADGTTLIRARIVGAAEKLKPPVVVPPVIPAIDATRAAELKRQIAELEASLKRAPGGGARARIKRKLEPLRDELKKLEEKPPPKVEPVPPLPPKPLPPPTIDRTALVELRNEETRKLTDLRIGRNLAEKRGDLATVADYNRLIEQQTQHVAELNKMLSDKIIPPPPVEPPPIIKPKPTGIEADIPDMSDIPSLEQIRKEHFGWTNKTAIKEQQRLVEARLPTVEALRKAHPGWTTKVAEKRLADIRAHLGLPPKPGTIAPPKPVKPIPAVIDKPPPVKKGDIDLSLNMPVEKEIALVEAKYKDDLENYLKGAGAAEAETPMRSDWRRIFRERALENPLWKQAHPEIFKEGLYSDTVVSFQDALRALQDLDKNYLEPSGDMFKWSNYFLRQNEVGNVFVKSGTGDMNKAITSWLTKTNEKPVSEFSSKKLFGEKDSVNRVAARTKIGTAVDKAVKWYEDVMDDRVARSWYAGAYTQNSRIVFKPMERGGRAYFQASANSANLAKGDQARIAVHEMGHGLEYQSGKSLGRSGVTFGNRSTVQRRAQEFLRYRAGNENLTPIYRGREEMGYKDKFKEHYMGKVYSHGATEIISMGMEELYSNPGAFLRDDPEYFWFMVGLLKGDLVELG